MIQRLDREIHRIDSRPATSRKGIGLDLDMTRNSWILVVVALLLGIAYLFGFTDLGRVQQIQINVTSRPFAPGLAPGEALPIIFGLDREWSLTRIRVAPVAEITNAKPRWVWNLASEKGSAPSRGFAYGDEVEGLRRIGGSTASALVPGTAYRLEVEAVGARGAVDFTPQAASGAAP